ncbi:MAG: hypothetical protein V1820_02125 [archaeon]
MVPKIPKNHAESLLRRVEKINSHFSLFSIALRALMLGAVGYFLYEYAGFPTGLVVLALSFELVFQVGSAYLRFLQTKRFSGFSHPEEFLALAVRTEKADLLSRGIGFLSAAASSAAAYFLFNGFFTGKLELLSAEFPAYYLALLFVFFRAARILPAYARYSWLLPLKARSFPELSIKLYLAEVQTAALDRFPPAVLAISLLVVAGVPYPITAVFAGVLIILGVFSIAELSRK